MIKVQENVTIRNYIKTLITPLIGALRFGIFMMFQTLFSTCSHPVKPLHLDEEISFWYSSHEHRVPYFKHITDSLDCINEHLNQYS